MAAGDGACTPKSSAVGTDARATGSGSGCAGCGRRVIASCVSGGTRACDRRDLLSVHVVAAAPAGCTDGNRPRHPVFARAPFSLVSASSSVLLAYRFSLAEKSRVVAAGVLTRWSCWRWARVVLLEVRDDGALAGLLCFPGGKRAGRPSPHCIVRLWRQKRACDRPTCCHRSCVRRELN